MICRNLTEYYNIFFNKLAFQYYQYDNFSLYINPQQPEEFIIHVHIADMYELFVGDFTAPYDIEISFEISETYLQLGMLLTGEIEYDLKESHNNHLVLMFVGRVGWMLLIFAIVGRNQQAPISRVSEEIIVG